MSFVGSWMNRFFLIMMLIVDDLNQGYTFLCPYNYRKVSITFTNTCCFSDYVHCPSSGVKFYGHGHQSECLEMVIDVHWERIDVFLPHLFLFFPGDQLSIVTFYYPHYRPIWYYKVFIDVYYPRCTIGGGVIIISTP